MESTTQTGTSSSNGIFGFISSYIVHILSATIVLLGGLTIDLNMELSKMATLKSTMGKLKDKELITEQAKMKKRYESKINQLETKNKELIAQQTNIKKQYESKINTLEKETNQLESKNKELNTQQENMKKRLASNRKEKTQKLLNRAKRKIATAPANVVPLLGVAAIIAMTTADVNAFCEDIEEMKTLEKDLYGEAQEDVLSKDIDKVCNLDIKEYLSPSLQNKYDQTTKYIQDSYNISTDSLEDASKYLETKSNNVLKTIDEINSTQLLDNLTPNIGNFSDLNL